MEHSRKSEGCGRSPLGNLSRGKGGLGLDRSLGTVGPQPIPLPGKLCCLPEPAPQAAGLVSFPLLPWASLKPLDVAAYALDPVRHPCLLIVSTPVLTTPSKLPLHPLALLPLSTASLLSLTHFCFSIDRRMCRKVAAGHRRLSLGVLWVCFATCLRGDKTS